VCLYRPVGIPTHHKFACIVYRNQTQQLKNDPNVYKHIYISFSKQHDVPKLVTGRGHGILMDFFTRQSIYAVSGNILNLGEIDYAIPLQLLIYMDGISNISMTV
jgi:hypothetical protein